MIKRIVAGIHGDSDGFTLVELLVVIAILAILVAVVVPNFTGLITRGKTEAQSAELKTIQTVVDAYLADKRISALSSADTVTPANYATGTFKDYFRASPNCNYAITTAGAVTQTSCP